VAPSATRAFRMQPRASSHAQTREPRTHAPVLYPHRTAGFLWAPYAKYATIDKLYSRAAYEAFLAGHEGWGVTQTTMNVVELGLLALWALYDSIGQRGSALLALISCALTVRTRTRSPRSKLLGVRTSDSPSNAFLAPHPHPRARVFLACRRPRRSCTS
jgi:hypothetical protein